MQKAAGGASIQYHARNDSYHSIAAELIPLIDRIQASIKLLEETMAKEAALGNQEAAVIVLDDVTPCYVKATAALSTCDARLGAALDFLLDATTSELERNRFAASDRLPFRWISRA